MKSKSASVTYDEMNRSSEHRLALSVPTGMEKCQALRAGTQCLVRFSLIHLLHMQGSTAKLGLGHAIVKICLWVIPIEWFFAAQ